MATEPFWLPTTFNLKTELSQFIAFYLAQKEKYSFTLCSCSVLFLILFSFSIDFRGITNYWIIKPFNLARSLDTHITDNLDFILRLAVSGPKICQKYIHRPVLFYRDDLCVKVRFIFSLQSLNFHQVCFCLVFRLSSTFVTSYYCGPYIL